MSQQVIRIQPIEEVFSITWRIGTRCNYDCMYCPTQYHDSTSKIHNLNELKSAWESVFVKSQSKNLKYKISFTGGEVTSNKDFLPFVQWLRINYNDQISQLLVTTNGSATYKYYSRLFDYVDNISFSTHSEFIDEQKFFDTVVRLYQTKSKDKFVHVNIMNEFWNQDRINGYISVLKQHNISYNVNEIDYSYKIRDYPMFKGKLNLEI